MSKRRDLNLSKYSISKSRYRELYYFCLQYDERLNRISDLENLSLSPLDGMPHGNGKTNPTERDGILAASLRNKNEAMEQAALEADEEISRWILDSAKYGLNYTNLRMMKNIPCGEGKFRKARRKFFYFLDKKMDFFY